MSIKTYPRRDARVLIVAFSVAFLVFSGVLLLIKGSKFTIPPESPSAFVGRADEEVVRYEVTPAGRVDGNPFEDAHLGDGVKAAFAAMRTYGGDDVDKAKLAYAMLGSELGWVTGKDAQRRWRSTTRAFTGAEVDWDKVGVFRLERFIGRGAEVPKLEFEGRGLGGFDMIRHFPPLGEDVDAAWVRPTVSDIVVVIVPGRYRERGAGQALVPAAFFMELYRLKGEEQWRVSATGFDGGPTVSFAEIPRPG